MEIVPGDTSHIMRKLMAMHEDILVIRELLEEDDDEAEEDDDS
jgi:hypothetical protein